MSTDLSTQIQSNLLRPFLGSGNSVLVDKIYKRSQNFGMNKWSWRQPLTVFILKLD
ncbi:hypothetical protein V6Z11_A10G274600 [Gossypium hirsutum]